MGLQKAYARQRDTFDLVTTEPTLATYDNSKAIYRFKDSNSPLKNESPVSNPLITYVGTVQVEDTHNEMGVCGYFDKSTVKGLPQISDVVGTGQNTDVVYHVKFKQERGFTSYDKVFKAFLRNCIMRFNIVNGATLNCEYADAGNATRNVVTTALELDEIYSITTRVHIDLQTNDVTQTLCVNGVIVDTTTTNVANIYDASSSLFIGGDSATPTFGGWITDFTIITGQVLTDDELIEFNKIGPQKYSLLADYKENEIEVTDGTKALTRITEYYSKAKGIYRFNNNVLLDESSNNANLSLRVGTIQSTNDAEKGEVALFDGTSAFYGSTTTIFDAPVRSLLVDFEFYRDADHGTGEIVSFRAEGFYFRILLSGEDLYYQVFHDVSNFYRKQTVARDTWHKGTMYLEVDNTAGTMTLKSRLNGVDLIDYNINATSTTNAGLFTVASAQSTSTYFKGRLNNLSVCQGYFSDTQIDDIHANGVYKYHKQPIYRHKEPITHEQLTKFVSFAEEKLGSGTLSYNVSLDGVIDQRWNGDTWTSAGSGYNTAITLNDNLQYLDASGREFYLVIALNSDGWQDIGFTFNQLGYNVNSQPTIIAGASRSCLVGSIVPLFESIYINDADGNINNCKYILPDSLGGIEVPVLKGGYATFQEAFASQTIDTTGWTTGDYLFEVHVEDDYGETGVDFINLMVMPDLEAKIDSIISNLALVKTETDKIQTIDNNVDSTLTAVGNLNDFDPVNDVVAHVTLVDTTTTNTDMVTAPDNASITAIKTQTDKLQFSVTNDIKATLDGETVTTNLDISGLALETTSQSIKTQTDKLQFSVTNDIKATLDGEVVDANIDLSSLALETSVQAIKTQTDKMNFVGTDIKSTLDGEVVTTDLDISALALETTAQAIKTETDKIQTIDDNVDTIQLRAEDLHDHIFGPADFSVNGLYTGYRKDGTQFFQARMKNVLNVATNQNFVTREIIE